MAPATATGISGVLAEVAVTEFPKTKVTGAVAETVVAPTPATYVGGVLAEVAVTEFDKIKVTSTLVESVVAPDEATYVTGVLAEVVVADFAVIEVTGAVTEAVVAPAEATYVAGVLAEVVVADDPFIAVTGALVEAVVTPPVHTGISSVVAETIVSPYRLGTSVYGVLAEVVVGKPPPGTSIAGVLAEVVVRPFEPGLTVTSGLLEVVVVPLRPTAPRVVRLRPGSGDTEVDITKGINFGIRDHDSRVDIGTTYVAVIYARAVYLPEVLPIVDPVLNALSENFEVDFSLFDDAAGAILPGDPADQTIEVVGPEDVYRIERTSTGSQEGFLYVSDDVVGERPVKVEATIDLAVTSTGPHAYVTYSDWTGVMLGLIYGPAQSGVFLFFRDDGTKRITLAGPSADGVGTRPVEVTVDFDWSADVYTYRIIWDAAVYRQKVTVLAEDSFGVDTLVGELAISSLNQFLASVSLGIYDVSKVGRIVGIVGTDGPTIGDTIDVYDFAVSRYGKSLMTGGSPTGEANLLLNSSAAVFMDGSTESAKALFLEEGTGTIQRTRENELEMSTTLSPLALRREEPDLDRREWVMFGTFFGGEDIFREGSFDSGFHFTVRDGQREFSLVVNFDFVDRYMEFGADRIDRDWTEETRFIIVASATDATARLFLDDDESPESTQTYGALVWPEVTANELVVGSEVVTTGTLTVGYLWLLTNGMYYETLQATLPEAQGWSRSSSGSTRELTTRLEVDATEVGAYDIYSFASLGYGDESGATAYFKVQILQWTDSIGTTSPPAKEFGPVAAVVVGGTAVQVFFVQSLEGASFVYLPNVEGDVVDVLAQNETGKRISAPVDLSVAHVFTLRVDPRSGIQLYMDYGKVPVIEKPWINRELVLRSLPTNLGASEVAAFGSLGEFAGVKAQFAFVRVSEGIGYDLNITQHLTDAELEDHIYGSSAEVFIDVQDED